MNAAQTGKRHSWNSGSTRPDVAAKIAAWWTPERREAKRLGMLTRNPNALYHGLSARQAARLVREAGQCHHCGHDGSESRLDIHHKDRDKQNQTPDNLEVLCHRCHMQEHARAGETGWDVYHSKRKS